MSFEGTDSAAESALIYTATHFQVLYSPFFKLVEKGEPTVKLWSSSNLYSSSLQ